MEKNITLAITLSNIELPCLWENGGKKDDKYGNSFLIGDMKGRKKTPIYIHSKPKSNGGHALIPIRVKDIVVMVKEKEERLSISIYSIDEINISSKEAKCSLINSFTSDKWESDLDSKYDDIIEAAKSKARTRDCLMAAYIKPKSERLNNDK